MPGDDGPVEPSAAGKHVDRPIFSVPFSWHSSPGHMVDLLLEHSEPGLVVDVECGNAPHAERLAQRGFSYVGVDSDPATVERIRRRGFPAAVADANDVNGLLAALDAVSPSAAAVSAVLALDLLPRLISPDLTLAGLVSWMARRDVPLFGLSMSNFSHGDVATKLMVGRFDITPSGLLDHAHLRFFTERSMRAMLRSVGLGEVDRHDVLSPKSDQVWPEVHPALSDGALLGTYLRDVRGLSDEHGQVVEFVGLYAPDASLEIKPTLLAVRPASPTPLLTAIVGPSCSDSDAVALSMQLDRQSSGLASIVRVSSSAGLSTCIDSIDSTYVSILQGGEHLADNWAAQFIATAARHPAAVIRTGPMSAVDVTDEFDVEWPSSFSLFDHFLDELTPMGALAYPTEFLRDLSSVWRSGDASLTPHELLLEASAICGVVDTGAATVAPRRGWRDETIDVSEVVARLGSGPTLMPPGASTAIATVIAQHRDSHKRFTDLETEVDRLRDDSTWLNAELARLPVRITRKVIAIVDRLLGR